MQFNLSPDRRRHLRIADVASPEPPEPDFSLEKYRHEADAFVVEKMIEWIAADHDAHVGQQLRAWDKLGIVVRWMEVFDPAQLEEVVGNEKIRELTRKLKAKLHQNLEINSQMKPLFPDMFIDDVGDLQTLVEIPIEILKQNSYAVSEVDSMLVQTLRLFPDQQTEIQRMLETQQVWPALLKQLEYFIKNVPGNVARSAANLIILDPSKQPQIQALTKTLENDLLAEDQRRIEHYMKNQSLYNQADAEVPIKNHLRLMANLAIIHADRVSIDPRGRVVLGQKTQLSSKAQLPLRSAA